MRFDKAFVCDDGVPAGTHDLVCFEVVHSDLDTAVHKYALASIPSAPMQARDVDLCR